MYVGNSNTGKFNFVDLKRSFRSFVTKAQLKRAAVGNREALGHIGDICSAFLFKQEAKAKDSALAELIEDKNINLEELYSNAFKLAIFLFDRQKDHKKESKFPEFLHRVMKYGLANKILFCSPKTLEQKTLAISPLKFLDERPSFFNKKEREQIVTVYEDQKIAKKLSSQFELIKDVFVEFLRSEFFKSSCLIDIEEVSKLGAALNELISKNPSDDQHKSLELLLKVLPLSKKISSYLDEESLSKLKNAETLLFKSLSKSFDKKISVRNHSYKHDFTIYSNKFRTSKGSTFHFRHFEDKFYISKHGEIILARDSKMPANPVNIDPNIKYLRSFFLEAGVFDYDEKEDKYILNKDVSFPSLNLMSRFVMGRNSEVIYKQEMAPPISKQELAVLNSDLNNVPLLFSKLLQNRGFDINKQREIFLKYFGVFDGSSAKTNEQLGKEYSVSYTIIRNLVNGISKYLSETNSEKAIKNLKDYISLRKEGLICKEFSRSELKQLIKSRLEANEKKNLEEEKLYINNKFGRAWGLEYGKRFKVLPGSVAAGDLKHTSDKIIALQQRLIDEGIIVRGPLHCTFIKPYIFSSKAAARAFVKGKTGSSDVEWAALKVEPPTTVEKEILLDLLKQVNLEIYKSARISVEERKDIFDRLLGLSQEKQCAYEVFRDFQSRFTSTQRFKPLYKCILNTLKQMKQISKNPDQVEDIFWRLVEINGLRIKT